MVSSYEIGLKVSRCRVLLGVLNMMVKILGGVLDALLESTCYD